MGPDWAIGVFTALLIVVAGCNAPSSPGTPISATGTPTADRPSEDGPPGTERATHVLVIESNAVQRTNVTVHLEPDGAEPKNVSTVLRPGETYAIRRDAGEYVVSVAINGEYVVNNTTVPEHKQIYINVRQNGSVAVRTIIV